jgi:hypothetical protein
MRYTQSLIVLVITIFAGASALDAKDGYPLLATMEPPSS